MMSINEMSISNGHTTYNGIEYVLLRQACTNDGKTYTAPAIRPDELDKADEDGWSGSGEQIIPLSEEAARQWAELHLTGEETEQIFSALNSRITPVAAYVPADLLEKLDAEKARSGRSRSDIVIDALRKYL